MVDTSNYLDFYDVFVNELVGDAMLTIIIALVLVWFLSIKNKMPFELSILFGLLILAIFYAGTQILIIWVFVVLSVGLMYYYAVNKAMK